MPGDLISHRIIIIELFYLVFFNLIVTLIFLGFKFYSKLFHQIWKSSTLWYMSFLRALARLDYNLVLLKSIHNDFGKLLKFHSLMTWSSNFYAGCGEKEGESSCPAIQDCKENKEVQEMRWMYWPFSLNLFVKLFKFLIRIAKSVWLLRYLNLCRKWVWIYYWKFEINRVESALSIYFSTLMVHHLLTFVCCRVMKWSCIKPLHLQIRLLKYEASQKL